MDKLPGPEKALPWETLFQTERSGGTAVAQKPPAFKKVRPRHRLVVQLAESGWKNKEIAQVMGYTEARISVILNSRHPDLLDARANFASDVADNVRDVASRFQMYANEMLDVMVHHARNKAQLPELSYKSARDILHMAGFSPVKKVAEIHANVPVEELKTVTRQIEEANAVVMDGRYDVKDVA